MWAADFAAGIGYALISIKTSLCGKNVDGGWKWLPPTAGALAFLALGSWGLRRHESRAIALAVAVGAAVSIVLFLLLVVPGTAGYFD